MVMSQPLKRITVSTMLLELRRASAKHGGRTLRVLLRAGVRRGRQAHPGSFPGLPHFIGRTGKQKEKHGSTWAVSGAPADCSHRLLCASRGNGPTNDSGMRMLRGANEGATGSSGSGADAYSEDRLLTASSVVICDLNRKTPSLSPTGEEVKDGAGRRRAVRFRPCLLSLLPTAGDLSRPAPSQRSESAHLWA